MAPAERSVGHPQDSLTAWLVAAVTVLALLEEHLLCVVQYVWQPACQGDYDAPFTHALCRSHHTCTMSPPSRTHRATPLTHALCRSHHAHTMSLPHTRTVPLPSRTHCVTTLTHTVPLPPHTHHVAPLTNTTCRSPHTHNTMLSREVHACRDLSHYWVCGCPGLHMDDVPYTITSTHCTMSRPHCDNGCRQNLHASTYTPALTCTHTHTYFVLRVRTGIVPVLPCTQHRISYSSTKPVRPPDNWRLLPTSSQSDDAGQMCSVGNPSVAG